MYAESANQLELRVIGPDGSIVFATSSISIGDSGEFKKLLNPPSAKL